MLKCGGSTRLHIFQGPEEEEEEKVETKSVDDKLKEEEGCNWGMDDDAEENEEDRGINPFALSVNEDLDLDDPKKTLRSWFEREGFEVEYNVEEKAFRTFSCSVQLPVDTPSGDFLKVETTVTGKKKEAMVACALEACRTLDHMGLLRQSHQESRQRKKKKWEENDYYDSDEDTFYDRTGEIEKRREMRKRLVKRGKVENFQSLENKLNILVSEIEEINKKLMPYNIKGLQSVTDNSEDSLESYMSSLSQSMNVSMDKFEKRKLKLRLTEAEKEKVHLEKMLNVARPAKLPSIVKHPGIIGKRLKSKLQLPLKKPKAESQVNREEIIEEVESSSENETTEKHQSEAEAQINQIKETDSYVESKRYGLLLNVKNETEKMEENKILPKDTVSLNSDVSSSLSNTVDKNKESNDEKMDFEVSSTTEKKNYSKKAKKGVDVYEKDNDYCTWTPPVNQSGDGMTHLNAKYGY
ncbi:kanadaptin [Caerostris extrusa]|uniref:Kanadaptin n=1 Tax=Caerostris extrusa TaxID=172846 RepID=A0AAV4N7L4_CAEEX|nr:kanadaptin [Caerostris extrusa]